MLIGKGTKKTNLETVRRIKDTLREVLDLPEDAITVSQLACLEEDCAPLETVIGLLQHGAPQLQYKIHKETNEVGREDLVQVCEAWGMNADRAVIELRFKEN